jgi:dihydropteroate synthase
MPPRGAAHGAERGADLVSATGTHRSMAATGMHDAAAAPASGTRRLSTTATGTHDVAAAASPTAPSPTFAGLGLDRPRIMGVINVTPDSFSDGGLAWPPPRAVEHGLRLVEAGADILDIGGESTRPGAQPVPPAEQVARVVPVVEALAAAGRIVSVDTRDADVMAAALAAGARVVNDVSALTHDPRALATVVRANAAVVLMHMQGEPRTMQDAPSYRDAAAEVRAWLGARLAACRAAGIGPERIALDPGIGFGKTVAHNLAILARLSLYRDTGCALLIGASRKSFIGRLSGGAAVAERLPGSLAAALAAVAGGAHIVRVHDVAATRQALDVWLAIGEGSVEG